MMYMQVYKHIHRGLIFVVCLNAYLLAICYPLLILCSTGRLGDLNNLNRGEALSG